MKSKTIFCVLLCSMILCHTAACSSSGESTVQTGQTSVKDTAPAGQTEESSYRDALPASLDFGGRDFRVMIYTGGNLTHDGGWYNYIDVDETNGDVMNDAAFLRNTEVEERLNVHILCLEDATWGEVTNQLVKSISAGDDAYDLVIPPSTETFTGLVVGNMLYDAASMRYMDLSQPYYSESSYKTYELDGKRYLFSGAYTYPLYSAVSWLYNKELWAQYADDDPYQLVWDGKWTIDTAMYYAKNMYTDLDGDNKKSAGDRYGFSSSQEMLPYLYAGFGMKGVSFDEDGFSYDYETERAADVVSAIVGIRENPDAYFVSGGQWDNFFSGNSLMLLYGSSLPRLRDLNFDFGFLPMPKFDEAQESYYSYMCGGLVCIPTTISDPDFVGATIEALFSASDRYMTDAFMEKFVESKVLRDEESVRIYRLMLDTAEYDFARYIAPNSKVGNYSLVQTLVKKQSADIASEWAKIEHAVKTDFDAFYDEFLVNTN